MNCESTRQLLEQAPQPQQATSDSELLAHLRDCPECRDHAETMRLVALLRTLPARASSSEFKTRALEAALAHLPHQRRPFFSGWSSLPLAMAASLVLAVFVALQFGFPAQHSPHRTVAQNESAEQVFTVSVRPMQTRVVDVVLDSKRALDNATLVVKLDDNLMLENRPSMKELRWQTNIQPGGNRLSLPVQLLGSADGEMTVTLEHGDTRQHVKVQVREDQSRSALPQVSI